LTVTAPLPVLPFSLSVPALTFAFEIEFAPNNPQVPVPFFTTARGFRHQQRRSRMTPGFARPTEPAYGTKGSE